MLPVVLNSSSQIRTHYFRYRSLVATVVIIMSVISNTATTSTITTNSYIHDRIYKHENACIPHRYENGSTNRKRNWMKNSHTIPLAWVYDVFIYKGKHKLNVVARAA